MGGGADMVASERTGAGQVWGGEFADGGLKARSPVFSCVCVFSPMRVSYAVCAFPLPCVRSLLRARFVSPLRVFSAARTFFPHACVLYCVRVVSPMGAFSVSCGFSLVRAFFARLAFSFFACVFAAHAFSLPCKVVLLRACFLPCSRGKNV